MRRVSQCVCRPGAARHRNVSTTAWHAAHPPAHLLGEPVLQLVLLLHAAHREQGRARGSEARRKRHDRRDCQHADEYRRRPDPLARARPPGAPVERGCGPHHPAPLRLGGSWQSLWFVGKTFRTRNIFCTFWAVGLTVGAVCGRHCTSARRRGRAFGRARRPAASCHSLRGNLPGGTAAGGARRAAGRLRTGSGQVLRGRWRLRRRGARDARRPDAQGKRQRGRGTLRHRQRGARSGRRAGRSGQRHRRQAAGG